MSIDHHNHDAPELRVLSLVLAFAAGVATMGIAYNLQAEDRVADAESTAVRAVEDSERARRIAHQAVNRAAECLDELAVERAKSPVAPALRMVQPVQPKEARHGC